MDSMCVQLWKNHCTIIFYLFPTRSLSHDIMEEIASIFLEKICPDDSHPNFLLIIFSTFYLTPIIFEYISSANLNPI